MEQIAEVKRNRFGIPVKIGILIAVIKIAISTIQYKWFVENWGASMAFAASGFLITIALMLSGLQQQKKYFGGQLALKEAFQAVFIMVLIFVPVTFIYDQLYIHVIDTTMVDRIYAGRADGMKNTPNAAAKLEELNKQHELEKNEKLNMGGLIQLLLKQIVQYSFLGFIFALVISRNRSVTTQ